jgi:3-hydroxyisobutyrate dehydrogenase-like beta-hydroxyacid dehydrogenase
MSTAARFSVPDNERRTMRPVGFIGLGQIGAPMAKRLLTWPGGLVVYDAVPKAMRPFADAGARTVGSPREVAEDAEVISVMVRDDAQVTEVITGADGLLATARPGTVIAIHATISDRTALRLARQTSAAGIEIVDAPVSGGAMGAANGTLAVMAGGSETAVEKCRKPFGYWANLVMHAGGTGAGTRAKLARNLLHFVAFTAVGEAARLAEAAGIDLRELGKVVRHSDAVTGGPGAIMLRANTAAVAEDDGWYRILTHVRDLGEKDLSLALELGDELGVDLPLTRLALEHFAAGLGVGRNAGDNEE